MTKEEIEALQEENRRLKQQAADRDARDAQVRQEQLHKDNVAFAEKLVAEGRLALHQKAVALSKKEGISYEAAVARCL